jgi:hypothetical protein
LGFIGDSIIFSDFKSGEAFNFSSLIKNRIFGDYSLINIEYYLEEYEHFIDKALKPHKQTILHDFIEENVMEDYHYGLKKGGNLVYPEIYELLDNYDIEYTKEDNYSGEDFHTYLLNLIDKNIRKGLTSEIFNLLFQDRELLRRFNSKIADESSTMLLTDHPNILKKDGVFIRCKSWPTWLKQALYRRDKGHCAICQKDLSSLYVNGAKLAIDHIIPLNLGGVNDPTNLQILCQKCNSEKGGDKTTTTGKIANYW